MKRLFIVCLVFAVAMTFGFTSAFAGPSAKATAQCGNVSVVPLSAKDTGTWTTIFEQKIKTPTGKDLFIDVSLECGLTTNTKVMSKQLEKSTANAEATVMVQVLVDEIPVVVNESGDSAITFARREQTLIAEFAGDISGAISVECDETGCSLVIDESLIEPETLQLILDTMTANSFNFIVPDLLAGEHTVKVQAKLEYDADYDYSNVNLFPDDLAFSAANAYLGNGSVTVETVRMIKGEDVIVDLE